jgi:DnaK suppressor protein
MSNREPTLEESRARELLQAERRRIEGSLADLVLLLEGEFDEIDTDTDLLDDGEMIEEEQVDDALAEQLHAELEAVERAEARLRDGTFGFSIQSGEPIPAERLEAIPWAERTASEQEHYGSTGRRFDAIERSPPHPPARRGMRGVSLTRH